MGKGTIIGHISDGKYNVTRNYASGSITAAIASLTAKETGLIALILAEGDATKLKLLNLQLLSVQKRIAYLQNTDHVPTDEIVQAWCADMTEDLTGEVGLIEIGREHENGVNIQPGYDDNAVYDGARDGQVVPLMAQTPAATFYNLAMLPGTQKWKPAYRYGTILTIDYDANTCDIILDNATSSQQELSINQSVSLDGVPIIYMSCNAAAFEVGNEVLIKFNDYDWTTPTVIGFKSDPKACGAPYLLIKFTDKYVIYDIENNKLYQPQAIEDQITYPIPDYTTAQNILVAIGTEYKSDIMAYGARPDVVPSIDGDHTIENLPYYEVVQEVSLPEGGSLEIERHETYDVYNFPTNKYEKDANFSVVSLDAVDHTQKLKSAFFIEESEHDRYGDIDILTTESSWKFYYLNLFGSVPTTADPLLSVYSKLVNNFYTHAISDDVWDILGTIYNSGDTAGTGFQPQFWVAPAAVFYRVCFNLYYKIGSYFYSGYSLESTVNPVKAGFSRNVAVVLEQPVLSFSARIPNVEFSVPIGDIPLTFQFGWGMSQLYIQTNAEQSDPEDSESAWVYDWDQLVTIDMSIIYNAYAKTFEEDIEDSGVSAGLSIWLYDAV